MARRVFVTNIEALFIFFCRFLGSMFSLNTYFLHISAVAASFRKANIGLFVLKAI